MAADVAATNPSNSVPLADALRNLAKQAHLNLMVDPSLPMSSALSAKRTISDYEISIRWENVTATQALAAILDNYDLVLVQEPGSATAKIAPKPTGKR